MPIIRLSATATGRGRWFPIRWTPISSGTAEKMQLSYSVRKTLRAVGARVSSHIVRRFGMKNSLFDDHLTIKLTGSAGQSLGAFAAPGPRIEVDGDAND